ncbi:MULTISPECIES: DUF1015 domain-containing protein [unclassified Streptosporangium]|uniref:DUF1015 domain-containing protein n=1 Tax=unclassified Streptosporangium TaxID=2632669 RepID=UPI002E2D1049|nr:MULTISPECIES: DUF1015 domain-containing protein [unclassified Streptosporangium]
MANPELPIPGGLVLRPFRGVRFTVDDLAGVTSPPYDLIDEAGVRKLLDTHPNNVVRLILPGTDRHRYAEARETLHQWLSSGVLAADETPAVYVYEQSGPGVLQRGIIGDVGLADPELQIVLPHENVMPGPVADRLALMRTTEANLEPIFLLYDGAGGATTHLVDRIAASRPPLAEAETGDGVRHRLWAVTDTGELASIDADLRPRQALIADGHHRYATYLALQREHRASTTSDAATVMPVEPVTAVKTVTPGAPVEPEAGTPVKPVEAFTPVASVKPVEAVTPVSSVKPEPWDFGLALLVDSSAYPPDLKAIHRVIPELPLEEALAKAKGSWQVHDHADLTDGLAALEETSGPAYLLSAGGPTHLLTDPDLDQLEHAMPAERSAGWRALNTSILAEFLLPKVWGIQDDELSVRIVHHDPEAAVRLAQASGGTAVLLRPLAVDDVLAIAAQGERVPRKSTSFGPKPRTGLVLRLLSPGQTSPRKNLPFEKPES